MKKYTVTVWKTVNYQTKIEVEATNEDEATIFACEEAIEGIEVKWDYVDSEFDATRVEEEK